MNNPFVSKKIQNYYNDLLLKDNKIQTNNSFYKEYVEHNILLLIIIVSIVLFLLVRYYSKYTDDDEPAIEKPKLKSKKNKINKLPKKELMSIIDELSTINEEIIIAKKQKEREEQRIRENLNEHMQQKQIMPVEQDDIFAELM